MEEKEMLTYLRGFVTPRRRELFETIAAMRSQYFTVAVEDVGHLHNTSAVMRSCEAFGIQDLHVVEERFGKRIDREIAMGAQKWTTVHRYSSSRDTLEKLREKGYGIVATSPHKTGSTLANFDITKPAALFFGSEAKGLSDAVMEAADDFIHIPTYGFTESLNISVSAAVIIQDLMARLRASEQPWQLTQSEQEKLQLRWLKRHIKNSDALLKTFEER